MMIAFTMTLVAMTLMIGHQEDDPECKLYGDDDDDDDDDTKDSWTVEVGSRSPSQNDR